MNLILISLAVLGVTGLVAAVLLYLVAQKFKVEEDPRIDIVEAIMPGANCGGCGYAGCADFAKALAEGKASLCNCGATSNESKEEISKILGIPFTASEKVFAVVKCAGGINAKDKFSYSGNDSCTAQITFMGGRKVCPEGCLGGGTCVLKCTGNGVLLRDGVALIDKALCEACGACVNACPKHIITTIPKTAKVYVACSTKCKGKDVLNACTVGCIGCGLCAKNCPQGAITMVDNLPVIDYEKCNGCKTCVAKCPRKSIKEI